MTRWILLAVALAIAGSTASPAEAFGRRCRGGGGGCAGGSCSSGYAVAPSFGCTTCSPTFAPPTAAPTVMPSGGITAGGNRAVYAVDTNGVLRQVGWLQADGSLVGAVAPAVAPPATVPSGADR